MKNGVLIIAFAMFAAMAMSGAALAVCSSCAAGAAGGQGPVVSSVRNAITSVTGISAASAAGGESSVSPVVERYENATVYSLNNTRKIVIHKNASIHVKPVSSITEHIKINGTSLVIHNVTNPALQITMVIRKVNGTIEKTMTITKIRNNRLNLSVDNVSAETDDEVDYNNGTVYISKLNETIELKTSPDMIREKLRERLTEKVQIRNMTLGMVQNKLKYMVNTSVKKNLLGFIPVNVDEEANVDADTGRIESVKSPWWGFLAW